MLDSAVTYAQLREFLLDLGFRDISIKDSHSAFRHEPSNTVVLLAPYESGASVREIDLRSVRRLLTEKGLIDPDGFDAFVEDHRLASSTGTPPAAG